MFPFQETHKLASKHYKLTNEKDIKETKDQN